MGVLYRFEQRLEHVVSSVFARAFRSAVQPVEIAASITREMDNSAQILSRDRTLVPNTFTVELSDTDYDRLSPYGSALSTELDKLVREHAGEQRYTLAGPVAIDFHRRVDLPTGRFLVSGRASAVVSSASGVSPNDTAIGRAPVVVEVNGERHPVTEAGLVLGRGAEADLRINDPGISRQHAEIQIRSEAGQLTVSVVDLGSTNGTSVDGRRVQQALLHDGSQIVLGSTTVIVRDPHRREA